jgi:hypothetical protein
VAQQGRRFSKEASGIAGAFGAEQRFTVKSRLRTNRDSCGNASAKVSRGRHRQLPPLNAVRAFEAAARAGGFQAAGVELHVSANAVGRLVKVLEDWLGVPPFKRLARGVALTEAGRSYLARVGALLDQLADATADVQRSENAETLTISATLPSLRAGSCRASAVSASGFPGSMCVWRYRSGSPTSRARKSM